MVAHREPQRVGLRQQNRSEWTYEGGRKQSFLQVATDAVSQALYAKRMKVRERICRKACQSGWQRG